MYNVKDLLKWRDKVQKEIDAVIEKNLPELENIITKNIPKSATLIEGMGILTIEVKGTEIENNFTDELNCMLYNDYFRTGCSIKPRGYVYNEKTFFYEKL